MLPRELMVEVFRGLDGAGLRKAAGVCKEWRAIVALVIHTFSCGPVRFSSWSVAVRLPNWSVPIAVQPSLNLKLLSMEGSGISNLSACEWRAFGVSLPNLRCLKLPSCSLLTEYERGVQLVYARTSFPRLSALWFRGADEVWLPYDVAVRHEDAVFSTLDVLNVEGTRVRGYLCSMRLYGGVKSVVVGSMEEQQAWRGVYFATFLRLREVVYVE